MLGTVCHITTEANPTKNLYPIGKVSAKAFSNMTEREQLQRLEKQLKRNLQSLEYQLKHISSLPKECHLFRISSELLPLYDHNEFDTLYQNERIRHLIESNLQRLGQKYAHIRLNMHPSQFCVINSLTSNTVKNSLKTLEMHAAIGLMLGRTESEWNTNIHIYAKNTDMSALDYLSDYARATLSFENGDKPNRDMDAEQTLDICQKYGVRALYDVHHHICSDNLDNVPSIGIAREYAETWKGVKPLMHISQGREAFNDTKHSDLIDNPDLIEWLKKAHRFAGIEIEAKAKSVAVQNLFEKVVASQ